MMTQVGCVRLTGIGRKGAVAFMTTSGLRKYDCAAVSRPIRKRSARMFAAALRASRGALTQGGIPGTFSGNVLFDWDAGWQDCSLPIQGYDNDYGQGTGWMEASVNGHVLGTFYTTQSYYAELSMWAGCADLGIWADTEEEDPEQPILEVWCGDVFTRGDYVTCDVTTPNGTITSASYEFVGEGGNSSGSISGSQLSGTIVTSGTLVVSGTVDGFEATAASQNIDVTARSPFQLGASTGTSTCSYSAASGHWGWTSRSGTCDVAHRISPEPHTDPNGVHVSCPNSGINQGICYIAYLSSEVQLGSGMISELSGSGSFSASPSDWTMFGCTGAASVSWEPPNASTCTGGMSYRKTLADFATLTADHEACHITKSVLFASDGTSANSLAGIEARIGSQTMVTSGANSDLADMDNRIATEDNSIVHSQGAPKGIFGYWYGAWGWAENAQLGGDAC